MQIKITEKWLLDRGAADDIDVTAGSLDDSKLLIETEKERLKKSRTSVRKPAARSEVPVKVA
jgi:phage gp46-like protein